MPQSKHSDCHPLLVDDDPSFIAMLMRALLKLGVPETQVKACANADEAIALLSREDAIPSFITVDHHMPRRTGLELLEWIRSMPSLMELPVFMLTSSTDPNHCARAFELGVGSYSIKPRDARALEQLLEGMLTYWKNRKPRGTP